MLKITALEKAQYMNGLLSGCLRALGDRCRAPPGLGFLAVPTGLGKDTQRRSAQLGYFPLVYASGDEN